MSDASLIIGLTGNIGTGKSTVLELMRNRGAYTIDADRVAHEVMQPEGKAYAPVVSEFGPKIVQKDGQIDRLLLGSIVFKNADKLSLLEQIVHPLVYEQINAAVEETDSPVIVIEAIKLLEAGMASALCDQIWVVVSPVEQQIDRLMSSRNMSRAAAESRMRSQSPQSFKVNQADVVIENTGSLDELDMRVDEAWQQLDVAIPT